MVAGPAGTWRCGLGAGGACSAGNGTGAAIGSASTEDCAGSARRSAIMPRACGFVSAREALAPDGATALGAASLFVAFIARSGCKRSALSAMGAAEGAAGAMWSESAARIKCRRNATAIQPMRRNHQCTQHCRCGSAHAPSPTAAAARAQVRQTQGHGCRASSSGRRRHGRLGHGQNTGIQLSRWLWDRNTARASANARSSASKPSSGDSVRGVCGLIMGSGSHAVCRWHSAGAI